MRVCCYRGEMEPGDDENLLAKRLAAARRSDLERARALLPSMLEIRVFSDTRIEVSSEEWHGLVLVGHCRNAADDGPELDAAGDPRWSWAVGVREGRKVERMLEPFTHDIEDTVRALRRRARSGDRA